MENQYGTILTAQGKALMAACILSGSKLDLTQAAVGDGGGSYYQPDPGQTTLKRETWRGAIAAAQIHPTQLNMIDVKVVIGSEVGGFIIREAALYTSDGVMLALCNLPDTEKVALSSGVSGKFTLLLHFLVEDASVLRFVVSPSLDTVSREEMDAALDAQMKEIASMVQNAAGADILEITVPADAWALADAEGEEETDFPYCAEVAADAIRASHYPVVTIHPESMGAAFAAGLCPAARAEDGTLWFWARNRPRRDLMATVLLQRRSGGGAAGGGDYVLPPATQTTLGGVMVGDNLNITPEGRLSAEDPIDVQPATDQEMRDMVAGIFDV